jgi:protein deglycase
MSRVLIPLAEGFEEIEAVTLIDVLRRADIEVLVADLRPQAGPVTGSRGVRVESDVPLDQVDLETIDMLVLPGGLDGTLAMMDDPRLLDLIRARRAADRPTAAICAAPMVLVAAGVEQGLEITSHPSVRDRLGRAIVRDEPAVVSCQGVLTSQGPGTSMEFALALVEELAGPRTRAELAEAMVVPQAEPAGPGPR